MNTPAKFEDLFFEVQHRPLVASLDNEPKKVLRYRVITCPAGVLGVKPAWLADTKPQPAALGRHLVFDHRQADALSRELYKLTFGVSPTPMHWAGAPPLGETVPLGAWAVVMYGHLGYTVADVLRAPQLREGYHPGKPKADWEQALWEGPDDFVRELAQFEPALAFTNGFDGDDELTFYVLLTLPAPTDSVPERESQNINSPQRRLVLVLKTGRFSKKSIMQLHELAGNDLLAGACGALPEMADSFRNELQEFAKQYYLLRQIPAKPQELVPVVLDLRDTNRNVSTSAVDGSLRKLVKRRIAEARIFFGHQDNNLAGLVRFFMWDNVFDPMSFDRQTAENVLIKRRAYRNLHKRLSGDTVKNMKVLEEYLAGQVHDPDAVAR